MKKQLLLAMAFVATNFSPLMHKLMQFKPMMQLQKTQKLLLLMVLS